MQARSLAIAMGLGVVLTGGPAAAFDPTLYAGTWSGTWKNSTFKVDGAIQATVTVSDDGQTLTIDHTIANLFNCGTSTGARVLTQGVDFTDAGLNFTTTNPGFGTSTVTSKSKPKAENITLKGVPTCRGDIASYVVKAKLRGTSIKGRMTVKFSQGKPKKGKTSFTATKQ